ncbi:uncharacterized protein [Macrobrachium rosenbergii]|uniref:uncharacterized protein n=1 Tax=Macrobrachium rosenbergii TaxID=79674 RepID=UPI0034D5EFEC
MERQRVFVCKLCFEYIIQRREVCFFRCGHTMCTACVVRVLEWKNAICHPCERGLVDSNISTLSVNYGHVRKVQGLNFIIPRGIPEQRKVHNERGIPKQKEVHNEQSPIDGDLQHLEASASLGELPPLGSVPDLSELMNIAPDENLPSIQSPKATAKSSGTGVTEMQHSRQYANACDMHTLEGGTNVNSFQNFKADAKVGSVQNLVSDSSCGVTQYPKAAGNHIDPKNLEDITEGNNINKLELDTMSSIQTPGSSNYDMKKQLKELEEVLQENVSTQESIIQKMQNLISHHENVLEDVKGKLENVRKAQKKHTLECAKQTQNEQDPIEVWKQKQRHQEKRDTVVVDTQEKDLKPATGLKHKQEESVKVKETQKLQIKWKSITELKVKREKFLKVLNEGQKKTGGDEKDLSDNITSSLLINAKQGRDYGTLTSKTTDVQDKKKITFPQKVKSLVHTMDNWVMKIAPGKVISVVSSNGCRRSAAASLWKGKLYLHHMRDQEVDTSHHQVELDKLASFLDEVVTVAFMDLAWGGSFRGRVHILLASDNPLAKNFRLLCTGEQGPSYVHTKFYALWGWNHWDERISGGDYEHNDGTGGAPVLDRMAMNVADLRYQNRCETGTVIASVKRDSKFSIVTGRGGTADSILVIGKAMDGFEVLKAAASRLRDRTDVEIIDCGVVLPM